MGASTLPATEASASPSELRSSSATSEPEDQHDLRERAAWQRRLLPLMATVLVVASTAFLGFSLVQTNAMRARIENVPQTSVELILDPVCERETLTFAERQACSEMKAAVLLEVYTIQRRYHQANAALMVRAWIKYLGFLTGMMIGIVGAVFILGRLAETRSELTAEGPAGKFSLSSMSPGLILVTLGTVLMITTVLVNPPTDVGDAAVYFRAPQPKQATRTLN